MWSNLFFYFGTLSQYYIFLVDDGPLFFLAPGLSPVHVKFFSSYLYGVSVICILNMHAGNALSGGEGSLHGFHNPHGNAPSAWTVWLFLRVRVRIDGLQYGTARAASSVEGHILSTVWDRMAGHAYHSDLHAICILYSKPHIQLYFLHYPLLYAVSLKWNIEILVFIFHTDKQSPRPWSIYNYCWSPT